jgi:hypothetical protein
VSYNRPVTTRGTTPANSVFNAEYPMVRWLESNGFNVSYISGIDTDRSGATILNATQHKAFLSVGHDEYWSAAQRANVETARAAGLNLAFFSGNEVFWKTRWEASIDGTATAFRTLVSYKETHANADIDPTSAWTGTWRDPRFTPPTDGGRPENALTGTIFTVQCCQGQYPSIVVPPAARPTGLAQLADRQAAACWDRSPAPTRLRYPGAVRRRPRHLPPRGWRSCRRRRRRSEKVRDYGNTHGAGRRPTSDAYRYASAGVRRRRFSGRGASTTDRQRTASPITRTSRWQGTVNLFSATWARN